MVRTGGLFYLIRIIIKKSNCNKREFLWIMSLDDGPASYYCPITQELMTDPVMDPEGNTFER